MELQEVDDADDTVYEYGLPSEEEGGFIGTLSNLVAPARREVIKAPEEKQVPLEELGMDSIPGETMTVKTPGEYGPVETDFSYAPIVRGAKSVLDYGKKLFSDEQTQEDTVQALKAAPAAAVEGGGKFLEDQMAAAMGMSAGYSSVNRPDGEVARFDPLAFTGAVAPAGIAAVSSAKAGETVLGIFGGKRGKSFAKKEKAFENAVDEGLDPESIPDNLKDDDYFNKMFLDQDVFVKSGGAFRGEDGILRYEIPTRNVKLKTEEDGGVFESFEKANTSSSFMMFNPTAFNKLQKKKVKEVRDNPQKFIPEGRDINERYANGSLVYNKNDILEYTNPITLKDVLDFPELYSEYPSLGNLKFEFGNLPNMSAVGIIDLPDGASASYNPFSVTGPSIAIDAQSTSKNEIIKSILHEVQHAVDATEDRQFGASVQAYLPKNANVELEKITMTARIATKTLEGLFSPEKFGNLYPDTDNYKALRGLTNEDARTIDLVRKLNSPQLIEKMRAKKPSPESHAGKLIEAHDSMDDMQRIVINLYDEQMGEKYKKLTEVYQEAQRKYFSTPGEVDARNIEDRFDNPDQQIGGDMPILPTLFKDLPDDTGKTIQKDLSLTGSEDVGDVVFKSASKNTDTMTDAGLTQKDVDAWRKANETSEEFRKRLKGRSETLQSLAKGLKDKDITVKEYREAADAIRPIRRVTDIPRPATSKEIISALGGREGGRGIVGLNKSIPDGEEISARLDINAYTNYDVWIPTLMHQKKTLYSPSVSLRNVKFIQPDSPAVNKALKVATGSEKSPFAVMTGNYNKMSDSDAFNYAKKVFDDDEWIQIGYDPTRRGYFYDRADGAPVLEAEEVVQIGHLVLAKKARKGNPEDFTFAKGGLMARR